MEVVVVVNFHPDTIGREFKKKIKKKKIHMCYRMSEF